MSFSATLQPPSFDLTTNKRHISHPLKPINNPIIPFQTTLPPTPPGSANSSPPPQFRAVEKNKDSGSYFSSTHLSQYHHHHHHHHHHFNPISTLNNNNSTGNSNSNNSTISNNDGSTLARRLHHEFPSTPSFFTESENQQHLPRQSSYANYHHHPPPPPPPPPHLHNSPPGLFNNQFRNPSNHPGSWNGTLSGLLLNCFNQINQSLGKMTLDRSSIYLTNRSPQLSTASEPSLHQVLLQRISSVSLPTIKFVLLCALWYSSSALSSNTGKVILNQFKYPVTLTIVQFGLVAAWCGLLLCFRDGQLSWNRSGFNSKSSSIISTLGIRKPTKSMLNGTLIMSLFSIAGHVFGSMAMARIPVSTVHTIKALSPLFTVIAYAGLFGVRYGLNTYFSLLPLTLGVMLACSFDMRANGIGFLCALGSTIVFVSQNIFGKKLLPSNSQKHKRTLSNSSGSQMDKLNLLFYSSAMAFLLMIPIWMWVDAPALLFSSASADQALSSKSESSGLVTYFIVNGTVHFVQCILAFTLLSQTSPVTYSIASLFKRVVVIAMSIVWFQQKVSGLQCFGMILTFLGLYIYNRSKSEIDRGERKRERQVLGDKLLLPSNDVEAKQLMEE